MDDNENGETTSDSDNMDEIEFDNDDMADLMHDSSENEEECLEQNSKEVDEKVQRDLKNIKSKVKSKNNWNFLREFSNSQLGRSAKYLMPELYTRRYYDSHHIPCHLKKQYVLEFHRGCVNALTFNESGNLLASGSDDLKIAIWDWARKKTVVTYNSGHKNNVFHIKFLPMSGDENVVSCARDGQIRLTELNYSGGISKSNRKLAHHSGQAYKLATRPNKPFEVVSVGEDGCVLSIDIREPKFSKLVVVKDTKGKKVPLYMIDQHPTNENQFLVCGRDQYVRVYDRRITGLFSPPVIKYCPLSLVEKKPKPSITSAVYSNNGDAILASYSDEDIYLFDTSLGEGADYIHRYSGHCNSATVKGVNFFSPSSNYIVSGSDCGNIFFWQRETEAIVQCLRGDRGVVNLVEAHPKFPILSSSGLENDIKIWMPTATSEPDLATLEKTLTGNLRKKHRSGNNEMYGIDSEMLTSLYNHMMRLQRRRRNRRRNNPENEELPDLEEHDSSSDSSSEDSDNDDEDGDNVNRVQCSFQ